MLGDVPPVHNRVKRRFFTIVASSLTHEIMCVHKSTVSFIDSEDSYLHLYTLFTCYDHVISSDFTNKVLSTVQKTFRRYQLLVRAPYASEKICISTVISATSWLVGNHST